MSTTHVIKRQGKRPTEAFQRDKLHASIVAACLSVNTPEGQADSIANKVCDALTRWLSDKPEVTSDDIRLKATAVLAVYHAEVADLYKHHHLVI